MAVANVVLKHWGSSLGAIVPVELVREQGLKQGDKVVIEIRKVNDLSDVFGSLRGLKASGQQVKDEARKNW